jgi:hypothetical protein
LAGRSAHPESPQPALSACFLADVGATGVRLSITLPAIASSRNLLPGDALGLEVRPFMSTSESQLAAAALETLHGARSLPPEEAAEKLGDFLASISSPVPESERLAEASAALQELVILLENGGAAPDDVWQHAIESMLSLTNEAG